MIADCLNESARPPVPAADWFSAQVLPHEPALRAFLRGRFRSLSDHDDLIQDAYLRILKIYDQAPVRHPKSLLFTIASRLACDVLRRIQASRVVDITYDRACQIADDAPDIRDRVTRAHEAAVLREAISHLPPRCAAVVQLAGLEQQGCRQVATQLGLSLHTVREYFASGLKRCGDSLRRHAAGEPMISPRKKRGLNEERGARSEERGGRE